MTLGIGQILQILTMMIYLTVVLKKKKLLNSPTSSTLSMPIYDGITYFIKLFLLKM